MSSFGKTYTLFDDLLHYYNALLEDIKNAEKSIYIESFKIDKGRISKRLLTAFIRAARRGVEVKILADALGTPDAATFYKELIELGGEVEVWEKIRFSFRRRTIVKSHLRDHRKIIVIDNFIAYIGSSNITDYSLSWRELNLRVAHEAFAEAMTQAFLQYFHISKNKVERKKDTLKPLYAHGFEILRDVPSITKSSVRSRYIDLIENAKEEVVIETPYFLPSSIVRKAMEAALEKGVKVQIIVPKHSDVPSADLLRSRYIGYFHEKGADIQLYTTENLHAKLLFVDKSIFSIGSSNFDYRSFRFQHEIVAIGKQPQVVKLVKQHIESTLSESIPFDYERWKTRHPIEVFFEWLLLPLRHMF
ncbi:phosphatidylserine/phosphatidylglycerophosphate/cardiolipin synthase family protein [Bacteroidales bacterium OttesenSCG-928-J16]|nr:phosphatidylserine/phosphatidylglycerophosphate/cardiolipin synthase family protein [Bacteroidales bacterium OttesenSCG-928-J16]